MALSAQKAVDSKYEKASDRSPQSFPMGAAKKVFKGSAVVLASTGYAEAATAAAAKVSVGIACETVDNTGDAAALSVKVLPGVFLLKNNGSNTLTAAHVGTLCYFENDETVSSNSSSRSAAGKVVEVDTQGVWVRLDHTF